MKPLKLEEISSLIKEQIRKYKNEVNTTNTGTVIKIGDGIALIHGLDSAMSGELLDFGNDVMTYYAIPSKREDPNGLALPFKCPYCNDELRNLFYILELNACDNV